MFPVTVMFRGDGVGRPGGEVLCRSAGLPQLSQVPRGCRKVYHSGSSVKQAKGDHDAGQSAARPGCRGDALPDCRPAPTEDQ